MPETTHPASRSHKLINFVNPVIHKMKLQKRRQKRISVQEKVKHIRSHQVPTSLDRATCWQVKPKGHKAEDSSCLTTGWCSFHYTPNFSKTLSTLKRPAAGVHNDEAWLLHKPKGRLERNLYARTCYLHPQSTAGGI